MKSFTEKFSDTFELNDIQLESEEPKTSDFLSPIENTIPESSSQQLTPLNSIESDTEFARRNIRELIIKGHNAIDSILNIADQSEHPRAFEVAANFIKNISDLNKDLLEIQKRRKDLIVNTNTNTPSHENTMNINQAVFVGSTNDILKLINENKNKIIGAEKNGNIN